MKNIKYILFIILLGFIIMTNVSAQNIEIKSIELDSKADNTIINNEPTYNGLEMNFDISFKEKDDFAKYKVVIKNDTDTDYKISNNTSFNQSEYITYTYSADNLLKAKSELTIFVTITYSKEVDPSLLVDNKYTESNRAIISLLDKDDNPVNPNTGINILLIIILLIVLSIVFTLLVLKKKKKASLFLITILLIVPTMVYAIETLKLTINVKTEINAGYTVGYFISSKLALHNYELENYIMTDNTQCDDAIILSRVADLNYKICSNLIYISSTGVLPGELVSVEEINNRFVTKNIYNYCELNDNNVYVCPGDTYSVVNRNYWFYFSEINDYGFKHNINDKTVMNFSYIANDLWESTGSLDLDAYTTFTMPKHNVLFIEPGR